MATNRELWTYDQTMDEYVGPDGQRLSPAKYQARMALGTEALAQPVPTMIKDSMDDAQRWAPPLPPNIPMVPLPAVLSILDAVGEECYRDSQDAKRYAAHVRDKVRALVNMRDPKELVR